MQFPINTGITLTESFAMLPTAAVSDFYFSHPDYTKRKGWTVEEAERWLAPVLSY